MENTQILEQAVQSFLNNDPKGPASELIVETLLEAEKSAKKNKQIYSLKQLLGTWRLCFITGTKKARKRAGIMLGSGLYLPRWIPIHISYSSELIPSEQDMSFPSFTVGRIENYVQFGSLQLALTGPIKFSQPKNILFFDFTHMTLKLFGIQLYNGFIANGEKREEQFHQESIRKQAFFSYFLIQDKIIAARGKGGGLAIWGKLE